MTDPTVSAYYSHPGTLMCEHCRAVWRISPSLKGDALGYMLERHDTHVCDPEADPAEVEAVRATARELAEDLPPKPPGGDTPVSELSGPHDPILVAISEWSDHARGLAGILRDRHGSGVAVLQAAAPAVVSADSEPWERVVQCAATAAWLETRAS